MNVLTVIPNQSYKAFVADYQKEGAQLGLGAGDPPRMGGRSKRQKVKATGAVRERVEDLWSRIARKSSWSIESLDLEVLARKIEARLAEVSKQTTAPKFSAVKASRDGDTHPAITAIAERHAGTPAQVILRCQLQLGHSIVPKSVRPAADRREFRPLRLCPRPRGDVGDRSPRHRAPRRTRSGQSPAEIPRSEEGIETRADESRLVRVMRRALTSMPVYDRRPSWGCAPCPATSKQRRELPLGEAVAPEELGRYAAFVLGDALPHLTGALLTLDSGRTIP